MRNLLARTFYDKRAFLIGWCVSFMALGILMTVFYPAFHQDNGLDQLVKNLPQAFQGLVGNIADLKRLPTYIAGQLYEARIPIFVSIAAIILAVGLSVAEEEKGLLRTLAALPISRTRIALTKWLGVVLMCLLISIATAVGIEIGAVIINEPLDQRVIARLSLMMWLLATCLATIVLALGLGSGRRGVTMGLGVLIAAGSFILTTFAKSVDWLQPYEKISLLYYFQATDIAKTGLNGTDMAVYAGLTIGFLLLGIALFRRRDIK